MSGTTSTGKGPALSGARRENRIRRTGAARFAWGIALALGWLVVSVGGLLPAQDEKGKAR